MKIKDRHLQRHNVSLIRTTGGLQLLCGHADCRCGVIGLGSYKVVGATCSSVPCRLHFKRYVDPLIRSAWNLPAHRCHQGRQLSGPEHHSSHEAFTSLTLQWEHQRILGGNR